MKRPSDWSLHFILYPTIVKICPVSILAIIQEKTNVSRDSNSNSCTVEEKEVYYVLRIWAT